MCCAIRRGAHPLNDFPWLRRLIIVALPVIVAFFYMTASRHFSYTPDGTYIYLQFAKNVVRGAGIAFNAGEPTYGVTSPLWLFVIALGGKLGLDLYMAAKAMDLVFASLGLVAFFFVAYEVIRNGVVALCATVAFSVDAWYLRWAGSGMETSLSVLLVLLTFLFCLRNEYFLSIVFAALLTLVRLEAILMVGLIILDAYINSQNKRRALKLGTALLVVYSALIVPWFLYARMTFGSAVPTAAMGNIGFKFTIDAMAPTFTNVLETIVAPNGVAIAVLIVAGIVLLMKRKDLVSLDPSEESTEKFFIFRQSLIGVGWIALISLFYISMKTGVVSRYLLLVTPFIVIYAFLFLMRAILLLPWRRFAYAAVFVFAALVMLQNQVFYRSIVLPGIEAFEVGMEGCLIPIGKWLAENTPAGSSVVVGDIGAIGYHSDRRVFDTAGLASPVFLPLLHRGFEPYDIIEKKMYRTYCEPDFVIDRSEQPERLKNDPELLPLATRPFYYTGLSNSKIIFYTIYKVNKL
ncbi:MAG: hypothetical protein HY033_13580 [Ignavibacteriae bacterium]|nr:hypothetical protein [Ignavibacteria bacterium]MBI3365923.1 hypothetical protein [Ignavibacteriota bacterium]